MKIPTPTKSGADFVKLGLELIHSKNKDLLYPVVKRVEEKFLKLINESVEYRREWEFDLSVRKLNSEFSTHPYDPDFGLVERTDRDGKDRKFFLHDKNCILPALLHARGVNVRRYESFLNDLKLLQQGSYSKLVTFAKELDKFLPGYSFAKALKQAGHMHTLRLNAYMEIPEGAIIAREHTDRCAFTLPVYESAPGLMLKLHDGSEFEYIHQKGVTAIFPGKMLQAMTGGSFTEKNNLLLVQNIMSTPGKINAVPHYVQKSVSKSMKGGCLRVSMVYFGHIPNIFVPHMK